MKIEAEYKHILLGLILAFISLTLLIVLDIFSNIDDKLVFILVKNTRGHLHEFMIHGTHLGNVIIILPLTALGMYSFYRSDESSFSIYYGLMMASSFILTLLVKYMIRRPRPEVGLSTPHLLQFYSDPSIYSYPSGHTIRILVLVLGFYLFYSKSDGKKKDPFILLGIVMITAIIGISRIVLGLHYPTDIVGSVLLGGVIIMTFLILIDSDILEGYIARYLIPSKR